MDVTLNMTGAKEAPVINNQLARARIEKTASAKLVRASAADSAPKATDLLFVIDATSILPQTCRMRRADTTVAKSAFGSNLPKTRPTANHPTVAVARTKADRPLSGN